MMTPDKDFAQLVESDPDYTTRVNPDDIIRDLHIQGPTFEAISRLKSDGLIRKIGVEVYNPEQLRKGVDCPALDFVVLDQSIIRQTAFEKDVLELISKNDMGVFAIRPLAGGWLTNTYRCLGDFSPGDKRTQWYWPGESYRKPVAQFCEKNSLDITETAIRFLLGQTVISSIVIGMRTVKHVNQALAALDKGPLPGALQEELESLFQQPIILEPE